MRHYAPLPPETFDTLSGLETLRAMIAGDLPGPPMAGTMNFDLLEAEEGRVVFAGTPLEAHLNPAGTVHGGWLDGNLSAGGQQQAATTERSTGE